MGAPHVCPLCGGTGYASFLATTSQALAAGSHTTSCPVCKGERVLWEPEPTKPDAGPEPEPPLNRTWLGRPEVLVNVPGCKTWPYFCEECGQTTWYEVNQRWPAESACCGSPSNKEDLGTAWWKALAESIREGAH